MHTKLSRNCINLVCEKVHNLKLSILEQNETTEKLNKISRFIDFLYSVGQNELLKISQFQNLLPHVVEVFQNYQSFGHRGSKLQIL